MELLDMSVQNIFANTCVLTKRALVLDLVRVKFCLVATQAGLPREVLGTHIAPPPFARLLWFPGVVEDLDNWRLHAVLLLDNHKLRLLAGFCNEKLISQGQT